MEVVVQKYGGSSLATLDKVRRVATMVADRHAAGQATVVVVSARGDTTDELLALAAELGQPLPGRETDQLLATGEAASAAQMALALGGLGVPAASLTGVQAGISVVGPHGAGIIDTIDTAPVRRLLHTGKVVVVAGFQGRTAGGDVATLGRGGSDTTAVALAAALRARSCDIYTDVDGVYTADPRVVATARLLPRVPVGVMAEMAFAGARVLHSRAVELAGMQQVPLRVRGTFSDSPGTVVPESKVAMLETAEPVTAIIHDLDVARVLVHSRTPPRDFAADILGVLAGYAIPVDLVARSGPQEDEFRMGFTIRRSDLQQVRGGLEELVGAAGGSVRVDENVGKVSLVGMGLLNRPESTARMLKTLTAAGIPTSWVSTSQLRTSVIVPLGQTSHALEILHHEFRLDRDAERAAPVPVSRPDGRRRLVSQ